MGKSHTSLWRACSARRPPPTTVAGKATVLTTCANVQLGSFIEQALEMAPPAVEKKPMVKGSYRAAAAILNWKGESRYEQQVLEYHHRLFLLVRAVHRLRNDLYDHGRARQAAGHDQVSSPYCRNTCRHYGIRRTTRRSTKRRN